MEVPGFLAADCSPEKKEVGFAPTAYLEEVSRVIESHRPALFTEAWINRMDTAQQRYVDLCFGIT